MGGTDMPSVYGDIQPQDEFLHPLGTESTFNESMYFNFFDPARDTGGFLRIGNRANEGYAEVTTCVYLPGGKVLFSYRRPRIASNEAFDAAGMRFQVLEPLRRHHSRYEGAAVFLTDPVQMADPRTAFANNPQKTIALDLQHEGVGPVYGSTGNQAAGTRVEQAFARGHYEQHMRVRGTLSMDGTSTEIEGFGLRDHSWGPRSWQALAYYRWLNCTFGEDFAITISEICPQQGERLLGGVVVRGDELTRITSIEIATQFVEDTAYHRQLSARVGLEDGDTLVVDGRVTGFIPLRNRRGGQQTHIGEGMTEYRCAGRVGTGISEYLDQL
jgi:hypothetical protein